jgi:hypothetical protein
MDNQWTQPGIRWFYRSPTGAGTLLRVDSQGGGASSSLVVGVMLAVVVVIAAIVVAFVPIGGRHSALPAPTVPPPAPTGAFPTEPAPTETFPTDTFPTEDPPTEEPTSTVPAGYQVATAPGGLSVAIPATWPTGAAAAASNVQANDPDADCFLRFGGDVADTRPLAAVVAGFEKNTPTIRRDYRRLQLAPVSYGFADEAVDWEFTFTAAAGPRHAYGRYWRLGGTDYVAYGSCSAGAWSQLGEPLSTMFATADPQ